MLALIRRRGGNKARFINRALIVSVTATALIAASAPLQAQTLSDEAQWQAYTAAAGQLAEATRRGKEESPELKAARASLSKAASDLTHPEDARVKEASLMLSGKHCAESPPPAETAKALIKVLPEAPRSMLESLELIAIVPRRAEIAKWAATDPAGAAQAERDLIAEYLKKYPGGRTGSVLIRSHFNSVDRYGAEELARTARELAASKTKEISDLASQWLKTRRTKTIPTRSELHSH